MVTVMVDNDQKTNPLILTLQDVLIWLLDQFQVRGIGFNCSCL